MHAVMSRIYFVCVLLFLGSLHAPSVTAADEHDRKERSTADKILALTDKLGDAYAKHDLDTEMDLWHPDAYYSLEGVPLAHGKEAIRKVERMSGRPIHRIERKYIEVGPNEEEADYVYVLFTEKLYNQEDTLIGDEKLLLVWRNTEDGYKISFLMVNSNE